MAEKHDHPCSLFTTPHTSHTRVPASPHGRANIQREQISQPSSLSDWTSTVCLCILRWLRLPPDSVRQTAVISHLRRRRLPDSGDRAKRLCFALYLSLLFPGSTLIYNHHTWFASALWQKLCLVCTFYQHWTALLKLTQVGQDIPWLHPLSISSLNWLPWRWSTPKPLIRSLFSLWARQCNPSSSPLLRAAKLA